MLNFDADRPVRHGIWNLASREYLIGQAKLFFL